MRDIMLAVLTAALAGCGTLQEWTSSAPPGRIVAISAFKCDCDQATRDVVGDAFLDVFFNATNAAPTRGDIGDIVVVGSITVQEGYSSRANTSLSESRGTYVSGITVQALKNGEMIASQSQGQDMGRGVLFSPVAMAQMAAKKLAKSLMRQDEIGRK